MNLSDFSVDHVNAMYSASAVLFSTIAIWCSRKMQFRNRTRKSAEVSLIEYATLERMKKMFRALYNSTE